MSTARSRRALALAAWDLIDQAAWITANDPGDEIAASGLAATWAPRSRDNAELAYGRYVGFLGHTGRLRPIVRVGERLVAEDLCTFGRELSAQLASITVLGIFASLNMAIKAMDPTADRTVLKTIIARLSRTAKSTRDIGGNLVSPRFLVAIGTAMMDNAEQMDGASWERAGQYRDGLLIMFMTLCPLRPGTVSEMRIGEHLLIEHDSMRIKLPPVLARKRRVEDVPLTPELTRRLARYLAYYRPMFPQRPDHARAVWLSRYGRRLSRVDISHRVKAAVGARTGKNFTGHMFRHACATHIVEVAPEQARLIVGALGHAGFRAGQKHYIKGQQLTAVRQYQDAVHDLMLREDSGGKARHPMRASHPRCDPA